MKKFFLSIVLIGGLSHLLKAQIFPSTIPDLKFRLELKDNPWSFTAGSWTDISGTGNFFIPYSAAGTPTFVPNSFGSGFSAVHFDGADDYLGEGVSLIAGNGFNSTEGTFFIVRTTDVNPQCTNTPLWGNYQAMLSIAGRDFSTGVAGGSISYFYEFGMGSDWAMHHSFSGNYTIRDHQCYSSLPNAKPVVITARFGSTPFDIDYYVNNILSATPVVTPGSPGVAYPPVNRDILIGCRYAPGTGTGTATGPLDFFSGDILEILGYNRSLNTTEIDQINEYLKCKYTINYANAQCNIQPVCKKSCSYFDQSGTEIFPISTSFTVNYTGANGNGDCVFQAIATVTLIPRYAVSGYEWTFPDGTTTNTATSALSDLQNFVLPAGTVSPLPVSVRVLTYNKDFAAGDSDWCCSEQMRKYVWCDASGNGGTN